MYIYVELSDGSAQTYGPCAYPPSLEKFRQFILTAGGQTTTTTTAVAASSQAAAQPRFARTQTYGSGHWIIRPPHATMLPAHTATDAAKWASTKSDTTAYAQMATSIERAFAKVTGGGLVNKPAWVVIYHNVQIMSDGPSPFEATEDAVLFFDDATGAPMGELDSPPDGAPGT